MSSVYGYILNDYIETYGVLSTSEDGSYISGNGSQNPCGVIYGDIMYFDTNAYPYLVLFVADGTYSAASCHIWRYNDECEKAERIAVITKKYSDIPENRAGEFNIAYNDKSRFISYNVYENNNVISSEFYTVTDGEAFMYLNSPSNALQSGIMDFNSVYFHPGVDVSNYNLTLDEFFSKLKNTAAKSVTYENIADMVNADDLTEINRVLIRASLYSDFDIARYTSDSEYKEALLKTTAANTFKKITSLCDLGDGIYYASFDTSQSKYNYALLRKSDSAEHGYQLLKVRTDCIPLADRELKQIKLDYMNNPLLYEMSLTKLELSKKKDENNNENNDITVTVGSSPAVTVKASVPESTPEAKKAEENVFPNLYTIRFPAACIGSGIAIALLSVLWIYLYSDN